MAFLFCLFYSLTKQNHCSTLTDTKVPLIIIKPNVEGVNFWGGLAGEKIKSLSSLTSQYFLVNIINRYHGLSWVFVNGAVCDLFKYIFLVMLVCLLVRGLVNWNLEGFSSSWVIC